MKNKIVFIISNGRSGSTILSKFLGAHSNIFALSEPHYFDTHFNYSELCSCEKPYMECDFWNRVVVNMGLCKEELNKFNTSSIPFINKNDFFLKKTLKYLSLFFYNKLNVPYRDNAFFSQIKNETKLLESVMQLRNEQVFVDASKSLVRAIFIISLFRKKYEYSFVFLNRDIRSVISSMKKSKVNIKLSNGKNKEIISKKQFAIKTAIKQVKAIRRNNNLIIRIFGIKGINVNYEKFTYNPKQVFLNLNKTLKLNWEETMLDLNHGDHHLLGGNYARINAEKINKYKNEWEILSKDELKKIIKIK